MTGKLRCLCIVVIFTIVSLFLAGIYIAIIIGFIVFCWCLATQCPNCKGYGALGPWSFVETGTRQAIKNMRDALT